MQKYPLALIIIIMQIIVNAGERTTSTEYFRRFLFNSADDVLLDFNGNVIDLMIDPAQKEICD